MCARHNAVAKQLSQRGLVTLLDFDTICDQYNVPKADARRHIHSKNTKCSKPP